MPILLLSAVCLLAACSSESPKDEAPVPSAAPQTPAEPEPEIIPPDTLTQPWSEPYYPFLADEPRDTSISVGSVTGGHLVHARALPLPALTYGVLTRQRARGLSYGSDGLIELIEHAAAAFYKEHGRRLWIGNIGRRGGGDIPHSVSHNSGRDADIAFCYLNERGEPVDPNDLIPLDKKGKSKWKGGHQFDAARTWSVVKALISFDKIQIQYLFLSHDLKKMILKHARAAKEDPALVLKADALMGQPGLTSPHNDHLHVRIHCAEADVIRGCRHQGRALPGTKLYEEAREAEVIRLVGILADTAQASEERARAIERLVLLRASGQAPAIAARLADPGADVRAAAVSALAAFGSRDHGAAIAARFEVEADREVQVAILEAMAKLGGEPAGRLLTSIIADESQEQVEVGPLPEAIRVAYTLPPPADPRFPDADLDKRRRTRPMQAVGVPRFSGQVLDLSGQALTMRLAAVEVAASSERPEPVEALVGLLAHPHPMVRGRAARALRRLTNCAVRVTWRDPDLGESDRERGLTQWRDWLAVHKKPDRDAWLAEGFRVRGFKVKNISKRHIWEMVRAIQDRDRLSYNAQRALMRLSGHRPSSTAWNKNRAARYWARWFERRRGRFGLRKRPKSLSF